MIEKVIIVPHSHIDIGYTDPQDTALLVNTGFIDDAIEAIEKTSDYPEEAAFKWTLEVFLPLIEWLKTADDNKKAALKKVIRDGRFEITAMPHTTTCFCDKAEWEYMLDLLPKEIHELISPKTIMQDDTNGIPREGIKLTIQRGVDKLWMGPNSYYGMPPMPAPCAFNWKIDDTDSIFVWCNSAYNDGTFLFNENWRIGPVPSAYDLKYRKPEKGDIFDCSEAGLEKAQKILDVKLTEMTGGNSGLRGTDGFTKCLTRRDYPFKTLVCSVSNQWRCDNDPPFAPLADFVKAWNASGRKPVLEIATAGQAMDYIKETETIEQVEGEWSDWWARGLAACPSDISFAMQSRRIIETAKDVSRKDTKEQTEILKRYYFNSMMYSEHTFSSWDSCAEPYSLRTASIEAKQTVYACTMLEEAEHYYYSKLTAMLHPQRGHLLVYNPTSFDKTVRLDIPANCIRGEYTALKNTKTGEIIRLKKAPGNKYFIKPEAESDFGPMNEARFSGDVCPDQNVVSEHFLLRAKESAEYELTKDVVISCNCKTETEISTDEKGWPVFAKVGSEVLIDGKAGDFSSARAGGISPRWTFRDVFDVDDAETRKREYKEKIIMTNAEYDRSVHDERDGVLRFTQNFRHPSLKAGRRILTIDTIGKNAKLRIEIVRDYSFEPEIFYILFDNPVEEATPVTSIMDRKFVPGKETLKGSCQDYFVTDGWVLFGNEDRKWLCSSENSVLLGFGDPHPSLRIDYIPEKPRRFFAQVFDNTWDTNFHANACGFMRFDFDIACGTELEDASNYSRAMATPCVIDINV